MADAVCHAVARKAVAAEIPILQRLLYVHDEPCPPLYYKRMTRTQSPWTVFDLFFSQLVFTVKQYGTALAQTCTQESQCCNAFYSKR